jgi:superfamily II DNA or RNA helicase
MRMTGVSTLCLVPTRVLLHQWIEQLEQWLPGEIGCFGDGVHALAPLTVATFESGVRRMSELGARFQLLVVDEVHHFGARLKDEALEMSAAPMRLGLTATVPNDPLQLSRLKELVGESVFELSIGDLAGTYLAAFDVVVLKAPLGEEERLRYREAYAAFLRVHRAFRRAVPTGSWQEFLRMAAQTEAGRRAVLAWRRAKHIEAFPQAKRTLLRELLERHRQQRVLVFTPDNESAYEVGREHLVMPLTCDIQRKERDEVLGRFRRGELRALVSSRVLNEGLDVPDAEVAIVVGGTLGEREHVQRVGRLLRPNAGKRATVYELVASGTSEAWSSRRRRSALGASTMATG